MDQLARRNFARLCGLPDGEIDVAEAALWIAVEDGAEFSVPTAMRQLDEIAAGARPGVEAAPNERARIEALNQYLFVTLGFHGNRDGYYDPRNSFLNEVLESRSGIPITLCVVYVEIARRLGLHAEGVGFPGHFLAKVVGAEEIVIDVFEAGIVTPAECEARLKQAMGADAVFDRSSLRPAGPREILSRMLRNLKQIYLQERKLEAALACCDRILLLVPDTAVEVRDRGLLYRELECYRAALVDLERFLELAPSDPSAAAVRQSLSDLRARAGKLH